MVFDFLTFIVVWADDEIINEKEFWPV